MKKLLFALLISALTLTSLSSCSDSGYSSQGSSGSSTDSEETGGKTQTETQDESIYTDIPAVYTTNGDLLKIKYSSDKDAITLGDDNARYIGTTSDKSMVFYTDYTTDENGSPCNALYYRDTAKSSGEDGSVSLIAKDIYEIKVSNDANTVYYLSDSGLHRFQSADKSDTIIHEGVNFYNLSENSKYLLYYADGDYYCYDGKDSTLLESDYSAEIDFVDFSDMGTQITISDDNGISLFDIKTKKYTEISSNTYENYIVIDDTLYAYSNYSANTFIKWNKKEGLVEIDGIANMENCQLIHSTDAGYDELFVKVYYDDDYRLYRISDNTAIELDIVNKQNFMGETYVAYPVEDNIHTYGYMRVLRIGDKIYEDFEVADSIITGDTAYLITYRSDDTMQLSRYRLNGNEVDFDTKEVITNNVKYILGKNLFTDSGKELHIIQKDDYTVAAIIDGVYTELSDMPSQLLCADKKGNIIFIEQDENGTNSLVLFDGTDTSVIADEVYEHKIISSNLIYYIDNNHVLHEIRDGVSSVIEEDVKNISLRYTKDNPSLIFFD